MAPDNDGGAGRFPDLVLRQQEEVRRSGAINMFDRAGVKRLAREELGFDELADWIDENPSDYIDMAEAAAEEYRGDPA